jgi:Skp family chaperone for outer membrane proteins
MKNIKYILTTLFFTFFISSAYSVDKIATLDVIQLLKESKAAISMKDQINGVAKKYIEEDKKEQTKIQKKEEELLRQKSTLTPEAFSDRKNTFEKEVIEFNKKTQKKRLALSKAEKDSVRQIEDEVEKIVKEIIDTEKITAVFRNSAVILSDKSIDITPRVVIELNKRLSNVTVKVTP